MTSDLPRRKAVIVGDGRVNGGSRALRSSTDPALGDYVLTVFEPHEINVTYCVDNGGGKRQCALLLWDTAGQEEYDLLRPLSYPETDVAVIFFRLAGPAARDSYTTVLQKWYPEIKALIPTARIVLIGTHRDVRDAYLQSAESTAASDQDRRAWIVTEMEGESLRRDIHAAIYIETSATILILDDVEGVLPKIARVAMSEEKLGIVGTLSKYCLIM
ncbi:Rho GTPase protein rac1 [Allomyces javanicus]|nr:Rho GTPase protein rac1 [Allomyces javanicus]